MSRLTWRFTALDSWFFRESRPFDVIGGSELSSVFPPSPATMAGAIRSAIGDHLGVDWQKFRQDNYPNHEEANKYAAYKALIGTSDSCTNAPLGQVAIKGVFLSRKNPDNDHWERLYRVPAQLMASYKPPTAEPATHQKARIKELHFLQAGKPMHCDLGKQVRLAVAPKDIKGIKALEDYWLTQSGLNKVLNGNKDLIVKNGNTGDYDLIHSDELFTNEPRLGIARNNQSRTAVQGNLYQTQHIRPAGSVAIEVDVEGLEVGDYPESGLGIVRLGGEGRAAAFDVFPANEDFQKNEFGETEILGIKLVLLSAIQVHQPEDKGHPHKKIYTPLPGFEPGEEQGITVWRGQIDGIALTLHCAVIGKVLREGGWDVRKAQPKDVQSLIPAGSVFFCKATDGDNKGALKALQSAQLDNNNVLDKALGRGLITAAPWLEQDSIAN